MSNRAFRRVRRTLLKKLAVEFKVPFNGVRGAYLCLSDEKREKVIEDCLLDFKLELPESCSVYENLRELRFLAEYIHNERRKEYQPTAPCMATV